MLDRLKSILRQRFADADAPIAPPVQDTPPTATVTPLTPNPLPPKIGSMGARAEAAVETLSDELGDWFQADITALFNAWQRVQIAANDKEAEESLFRSAHNLSGMGATYGKPEIGRLCRSLSKLVARGRLRSDFALIGLHIDACRAACSNTSDTETTRAVCNALEAEVAKLRAA